MEKVVLAVDPGTSKCGLALVHRDIEGKLDLLWRDVVPTAMLLPKLHEAYAVRPYEFIILGDSTHSTQIMHAIREHLPSMALLEVDERDTSQQARERYWEHHRRRGWRRMLPASMIVPPEPVDDFAALILAERVLAQRS
jgi:RNase H-fold protein (predicted Holliday junction resolvase)